MDMYMLTKTDIAALKQCDYFCVHKRPTETNVYAVKKIKADERNPFAQDATYTVAIPVSIDTSWRYDTSHSFCFAMVYQYQSQRCDVSSIIATLKAGDEVKFRFYPDCHTNKYCEDAGLHGDALYLDVYRAGKHHATWQIDRTITPDNTARMCRGLVKKQPADA